MSNPESFDEWFRIVDEGLREGAAKAIQRRKRLGLPIYVWPDGQVVAIPPEEIPEDGGSGVGEETTRGRVVGGGADHGARRFLAGWHA